MITESIKDYVFSLENYSDCTELNINKFDIEGKVLLVDFRDLRNFPNLKVLSICNMTISENDMQILSCLENLDILKLINCDFTTTDALLYFNNLKIDELVLDNTIINFELINRRFRKIVLKNMNALTDVNCDSLDLSKSQVNFKNINIESHERLIICKSQYLNNLESFEKYKGTSKIVIMNDFFDEEEKVYE